MLSGNMDVEKCIGRDGRLVSSKLGRLGKVELWEFLDQLPNYTTDLSLADQPELDDSHLETLAQCWRARWMTKLDLSNTAATYGGLGALWKSPFFGKFRADEPAYERHYNLPISTVTVEIAGTEAARQREKIEKLFPLPLREGVKLRYPFSSCSDEIELEGLFELRITKDGMPYEIGKE